jgi:hypothetical protein
VFHFLEFINSVINSASPTASPDCPDELNAAWLGDGECDDTTNIPECGFDGGDCCGENVDTSQCTECQCLTSGTEPPTPTSASTKRCPFFKKFEKTIFNFSKKSKKSKKIKKKSNFFKLFENI